MTQDEADQIMKDATYLLEHRAESAARTVEMHQIARRQYETLVCVIVGEGLDPWRFRRD